MTAIDQRLPKEIHDLWPIVVQEVDELQWRWVQYQQLYGTSAEVIHVLNASASQFFGGLEGVLLSDIQLGVGRLGDPLATMGKPNASLHTLHEALKRHGDSSVIDEFSRALHKFMRLSGPMRARRNKWIAHADLVTLQARAAKPLMHPSRDEVRLVLDSACWTINCVEKRFLGTSTDYSHMWSPHGADQLVERLRRALRYDELVRQGTVDPLDILESGTASPRA